MKTSQAYIDDEPSGPEIMEVASAHYEACEVVQAQLDVQRNSAVVEGQVQFPEGQESGALLRSHVQMGRNVHDLR